MCFIYGEIVMKVLARLPLALLVLMGTSSAFAETIIDEPNRKAVGHVTWQKHKSVDARALSQRAVPHNEASLFFIREVDNDGIQTSANIAVNDRFQVSLQPGKFSQVNSCAGLNDLSVEITGHKSNDLLYDAQRFDLQPQGTYFFFVKVDEQGKGTIEPLTHDSALQYIEEGELQYQVHQISRVVKDVCAKPIAPLPMTPPPLTPPVEPVAKVPVSIELEVLFDTDKSFVKPHFYNEVARVADFMKQHPQVTAVIEGHTDSRASDEYNIGLSQRRVDAVRTILINEYGVDPRRISSKGYGESRPRATNATPEGRQLNRRVVATFSGL